MQVNSTTTNQTVPVEHHNNNSSNSRGKTPDKGSEEPPGDSEVLIGGDTEGDRYFYFYGFWQIWLLEDKGL